MAIELEYTGEFENFYPYPLSEEAKECVVGAEIYVDQLLTRQGNPPRLAYVLEVYDYLDGRRVRFLEKV